MKRIALMLSIFMLFVCSFEMFAADVEKSAIDTKSREKVTALKDAQATKQENSAKILGETVIFMEDFENNGAGWFGDGGYANNDGSAEPVLFPPAWNLSQDKAYSPVTSLFHGDDVESSRDFFFSPAFEIPMDIDGDPVVSAKVSYQLNIHNPGYGDPNNPGYLGDYYMVYAGLEETTWGVVDVAGNMAYYSGYPDVNSFQYLTSPVIDLTAATAPVKLDFKFLMINELHWDLGRIDVLVDGEAGYTAVGTLNDDTGAWLEKSIDLSTFAGKKVQVRFAFLVDDATSIENGGLWLDDIKVTDANGEIFKDEAETGSAVMEAFGVTLARLFYDYDRVEDGGAEFHYWDESGLFNGTADLFDLGVQPGDKVWLAFRYIVDGDNTQGEAESAGAFFDDLMVTAISGVPADAGISDLVVGYPQTQGLEAPVAATVSNFGFEAQSIALWYKFDDGSGMPVPPYLNLDAFTDSTKIFGVTVPEADTTDLTAYTMLTGDMVPENDALTATIATAPAGVATFSYINGGLAYISSSNRTSLYDPLSVLGVDKYNIESVDIYLYNTSAVSDVANVKVATWDEDPLTPTAVLVDTNITIPGPGTSAFTIPVMAMDVMTPCAVWVNFSGSAGTARLLMSNPTPFAGNEIVWSVADGAWYVTPYGHFIFLNTTYPTAPGFDIAIDAEKDAWYEQLTGPANGHIVIPAAIPNTNGEPANDADLSAKLWTAWDETYLYLYEEVKDNVVNLNNATSWQDDVLEVYIDPNPTAAITTAQLGFHMTALDSADADPAALAGVINLQGYNLTTGATTDDYARKRTDDGYVLECRVKWEVLKDATRSITPAVGTIFGMATMNHDNDVAQREGSISFATVLNDNVWNTPAHHGTVEFLPDNMLKLSATNIRNPEFVNTLAPLYEPNDLPEPWLTMDVGAVGLAGSAAVVDGKVQVTGGGADIWGTKDEFRFVFQTMSGDIEITANLEELTQSDPWTKGTLMIRDALNDSSAHAIIAIASANGEAFQYRPAAGKESIHIAGITTIVPPKWLKLIRMGNTLTGYTSTDGMKWFFIGSTDVVMKDPVFVGMAVTSHNDAALSIATYSGIEVSNEPMVPELDFTIAIDAAKDPWYKSLTGPENGYLAIPAAAYNTNGQPDNAADLSAFLWTAWDENYLYLYEEVKDDKVNLNNATSWQDDVLEVYIDPNPSAAITTPQLGFHMTALDSADADPAALAGVINLQGYNLTTGATKADYARAKVTGGYVLECRVAWDSLKDATRSITPAVGSIFGMATMNHDNDVATREGSVSFATVLNDNVWNTPAHHGTVEMLDGHQLKFTASNLRNTTFVNGIAPLYSPTKLPSPWLTMDIGNVGTAGSAVESGGTWDVSGSGADIWGPADAFRFAFQVLKGDVEFTAKLTALTKSDPWTKGALMIRDELTADSKHAIIALASDNGQAFQYRPEKAAESVHIAGLTTAKAPQWLKIIRLGDTISGWVSADGKAWDKVGQVELPMADQIYVGMAVTAHDAAITKVSKATFTNVATKVKNITAVEENIVAEVPTQFNLAQNYPNPFNPTTNIQFDLPIDSQVKLTVFDILGREVVTLVDERMVAGQHRVSFDAAKYATGVYFYRLKAGDLVFQKKMMLVK